MTGDVLSSEKYLTCGICFELGFIGSSNHNVGATIGRPLTSKSYTHQHFIVNGRPMVAPTGTMETYLQTQIWI